jgi:hypothetical protein
MNKLHEYNLELLEKNDLISYWASAINGRNIKIEVGDYLFDDYITDTNIFFPEKKNYMVFDHNADEFCCLAIDFDTKVFSLVVITK